MCWVWGFRELCSKAAADEAIHDDAHRPHINLVRASSTGASYIRMLRKVSVVGYNVLIIVIIVSTVLGLGLGWEKCTSREQSLLWWETPFHKSTNHLLELCQNPKPEALNPEP